MGNLYKIFRVSFLKSMWVNIYCLPFRQAIRFPILLARGVRISSLHRGAIQFTEKNAFFGGARFGFQDSEWSYDRKSLLNIQGTLVLSGRGYHSFASGLSLSIAKGAIVRIGNNFSCSHNTRITIFKSLIVGNNNMWSYDNIVIDSDAHKIFYENGELISKNAGIVFGEHVWIGCRNLVLKGVKVPNGCILGAGGVVTKILDKDNAIYVGDKLIRENISWNSDLNND